MIQSAGVALAIILGLATLWLVGELIVQSIVDRKFARASDSHHRWSGLLSVYWFSTVLVLFSLIVLTADVSGIAKLKPLAPFAVLFAVIIVIVFRFGLYRGN